MGGITSTPSITVGSGLSGAGTAASPLVNTGVVSAGNGLSGTNPIVVAAPSFSTVGSYVYCSIFGGGSGFSITAGSTYSAGSGTGQVQSNATGIGSSNNLSGTWRWMGASGTIGPCGSAVGIAVRIA